MSSTSPTSSHSSSARTSQACENCRIRKSRCQPTETPGVCQRCVKSNSKCVFLSKAPPKAATGQRVLRELQPAKVEEQDILPSLIWNSGANDDDGHTFESFHRDMMEQIFPQVLSTTSQPLIQENQSTTSSGYQLTLPRTKVLIDRYQSTQQFTPYVQLPPDWTVESMLCKKPVLTLAIVVAMSLGEESQRLLDLKLRQVLAQKVHVQRLANLDILQGLLVYLAWIPVHLSPRRTGLFQFLSMMTTIVKDMRLDSLCHSMERKRSYLGAFYIASMSAIPRRPNQLLFTDQAAKALDDLAKTGNGGLDKDLVALLTVQRVIEEIDPDIDALKVQELIYRVQAVEPSTGHLKSYVEVLKSYGVTRVHNRYIANVPVTTVGSVHLNPDHLARCITSLKETFAIYPTLPDSTFVRIPIMEWGRLIQSTITLFMLMIASPGNMELSMLEPFFDTLQQRMADHSRHAADGFALWNAALGIVKEKYLRLVEEGNIFGMMAGMTGMTGICPVHSMEFSTTDFWDSMVKDGDLVTQGFDYSALVNTSSNQTNSSNGNL